ncbi:MAG: methane monooxygenase/ammonia monooxygenase subunit A [Gammaproteobacteria bacterium]
MLAINRQVLEAAGLAPEAARLSRIWDFLVVAAVILLFMGAIHLHVMLTVGDWDMFIDWKDRQFWVLVMHSANDALFPGFGAQTAKWWAGCNHCDAGAAAPLANGCMAYQGCAADGATWYCEGNGAHREWPDRNDLLIEFLTSGVSR